jgi:hypothetical protein
MEGTSGAGDRAGRLSGVSHSRELPAPLGMPVPGGVEHRKAPERLPDAARTPWELRTSRRSAGSWTGETPWGAGSTRHGSPRRGGLKRERGTAGAKAPATVRETCAPEGTSRPWNHGRGTRPDGLKRLRACGASDLVFLRVRGCGATRTDGCSGHGNVSRPDLPKGPAKREPQERQRTQRVREAGGRASRRGGERPRGRTVPGVASPGPTDPSADVAEGARNPRRGDPVRAGPERASRPEP